jgi:hypothetical protein
MGAWNQHKHPIRQKDTVPGYLWILLDYLPCEKYVSVVGDASGGQEGRKGGL